MNYYNIRISLGIENFVMKMTLKNPHIPFQEMHLLSETITVHGLENTFNYNSRGKCMENIFCTSILIYFAIQHFVQIYQSKSSIIQGFHLTDFSSFLGKTQLCPSHIWGGGEYLTLSYFSYFFGWCPMYSGTIKDFTLNHILIA